MVDVQPAVTDVDKDIPLADKDSVEGIVLDLNSNHEDDGQEDAHSETEHENGTEETAEMDDEKHLDDCDDVRSGTPEPVMSFDREPADRVPETAYQPMIQNYCISDSETDSFALLQKPDFQMPTHKRTKKKERSTKKGSEQKNGQNGGSRREQQTRMRYKDACKCQEIRNDPKLKTKVCIIL